MSEAIWARILPPLYGLNGVCFPAIQIIGCPSLRLAITLIDRPEDSRAFRPLEVGGGILYPEDNWGRLHNTRVELILPDGLVPRERQRSLLLQATNLLIDWYRLLRPAPSIRRLPDSALLGVGHSDNQSTLQSDGWLAPGEPSMSADFLHERLAHGIAERLAVGVGVDLWATLYLDALAEFRAGELRSAVMLVNASMQTLITNAGDVLEIVGRTDSSGQPLNFRPLLKAINRMTSKRISHTKLVELANIVDQDRNDVVHGRRGALTPERAGESIAALYEIARFLDSAIERHLTGKGVDYVRSPLPHRGGWLEAMTERIVRRESSN